MTSCDVVIIGAGPYGLSIAAHLKKFGVSFRIFGKPMGFWLSHMPKGMHLKSEGFASSLYDPGSTFTLAAYCEQQGIPYAALGAPVPIEVFTSYGLAFQKKFVPEVEEKWIVSLDRANGEFQLKLDTGETVSARRVIVAVGLTYYKRLPEELAALPADVVSHSSEHGPIDQFAGRDVAIVGGGSSAIDLAALLHQKGANVQVVARAAKLRFHDPPNNVEPSWLDRLRTPITGIGPGWKLFLCSNLPLVFRQMPDQFRVEKVRQILGPAPCWFTKEQVVGKVGFHLGASITGAGVKDGKVTLDLTEQNGAKKTITADHVIAATGYKSDLQRLPFLPPDILGQIRMLEKTPVLSSNFESTVKGLYFVGITSSNTFGPLLRFAFGAGFAAPRISRHLARTSDGATTRREVSPTPRSDEKKEKEVAVTAQ